MKTEFQNVEKLRRWFQNVVNPTKYDLYYVSEDRRLIAMKNVSTEPRIHGYVDSIGIDDAEDLADEMSRVLTHVKTFEWEHEETESSV